MKGVEFVERYLELSREKETMLCVGVDPAVAGMRDKYVIPQEYVDRLGLAQAVKEFSLGIIEAAGPYTALVKPNAQFLLYVLGLEDLREVVEAIHEAGCLALLDAKLSDIGTTMEAALYWLDQLGFDAVTFSPFPGYENGVDALYKWCEKGRGIFALCRMSNPGAHDYQSRLMEGEPFYLRLARDAASHGANGFVVGCTATRELLEVREAVGEEPLILSPGLGPQGGDPETALRYGSNSQGERLVISSSRSINYAFEDLGWGFHRFQEAAAQAAKRKRDQLNETRRRLHPKP